MRGLLCVCARAYVLCCAVFVCLFVCVFVLVRVCVCVCACVWAGGHGGLSPQVQLHAGRVVQKGAPPPPSRHPGPIQTRAAREAADTRRAIPEQGPFGASDPRRLATPAHAHTRANTHAHSHTHARTQPPAQDPGMLEKHHSLRAFELMADRDINIFQNVAIAEKRVPWPGAGNRGGVVVNPIADKL